MKGLLVNFLRNAGYPDTSLGGVSARFDDAYLIGPGVTGPDEVPDDAAMHQDKPVLRLWPHELRLGGDPRTVTCAVPNDWYLANQLAPGRACFGGNFVYASDSRFTALNDGSPIKVHDRNEFKPGLPRAVGGCKVASHFKVVEVDGHSFNVFVKNDYGPGKFGKYVQFRGVDGKELTPPLPPQVWREIEQFVYLSNA